MAKKKKTTARSRTMTTTRARSRRPSSRVKRDGVTEVFGRFGLPLMISVVLIAALAVLGFTFYSTATNSDFFKVKTIDVRGNDRTNADDPGPPFLS